MSIHILTESVPLASLKPHPRQNDFFAATSEAEVRELAADMKRRGQQEPIHCLSDGTIIRGHRRVRAAKLLGWEMIQAVVRNDLGDAGDDEVIDELIADNLMRQQLDELSLARCYHELKRTRSLERDSEGGDVRDCLATRLNCGKSGRSLDRLERLLQLPRDVQDMISHGSLNKTQGEGILKLSQQDRAKLIGAFRSGEAVRVVLRRFGIVKSTTSKSAHDLGRELLAFFQKHLGELHGNLTKLDRVQVRGADANALLDAAVAFLTTWRNRKSELYERSLAAFREDIDV